MRSGFNENYNPDQAPASRSIIFSYITPVCLDWEGLALSEPDGTSFELRGNYNANGPTYISVFFNVTEIENLAFNLSQNFLIAEKGAFEKHLLCKEGRGKGFRVQVKFPLATLTGRPVNQNPGFPESHRYKLVIRLEPQAHPHHFVNVYYFELEPVEGRPTTRLVKHKIELKDKGFYVYDIYGMDSVKGNKALNQNSMEQFCKFCLDRLIEIIILPCRHMCLCMECAKLYNERNEKNQKKMKPECPVCKSPITNFLNIQGKNILSNTPFNSTPGSTEAEGRPPANTDERIPK